MMDFIGKRRTMKVYLFCVFWLLTVSTIPLSEAKVGADEEGLKIVPDYFDESHKVETNESERYKLVSFNFHHVEVPYVICLWILLASIAKIGFHLYDRLPHIFPESCVLIVMGILVGVTLYYTETADATQYALDAKSFFLFLLPPIIYDAGYHMPNRAFFNNIGTILLLAVVNTLWNTVGIGLGLWGMSYLGWIHRPISILNAFVFSALISAVDPVAVLAIFEEIQVNEILYILVFGESLLNDGVTVVLYHMMEGFTEIGENKLEAIDFITGFCSFFIVVFGGTLIGVIYGLVGAFITKYTDHVRIIEPIFIFVLGYMAYLTAESMELSGILALTFGGIIMRHYTEANMAKKSTTTVKYFMKMMANVSETIIFMFLGLSTVIDSHEWYLDFILFTILFCIIFRVTGVIFLSFMVNRRRVIRLSAIDQFIMSYGGLRGGIAFCLALLLNQHHIPEKDMFVTTTMVMVFFTVFVQGITIKPVVNALKVERAEEKEPSMNEIFHRRVLDHLMAGVEDIVGKSGHNSLHHKFEYYNNKYLKPWLLREKPKTRDTSIIRVFTKLNMQDAKATAKAFPGSMSRDPSWSQFNLPAHSPSMSSLSNRRATIAVPNDQDSDMIINMHGMDPTSLKQMPDDLTMHRVLEDSLVSPRASWSQERRHTLAEIHNPYGHSDQDQIRHLFGNGGVYAAPQPPVAPPAGMMESATSPGGPRMANGVGRKVRKNVSFSAAHGRLGKKLSDVLEQSFAQESGQQSEDVPDIPEVSFSLGEISPTVYSPDSSKENPLAQAANMTQHPTTDHPSPPSTPPSPPLPSPPPPLSPSASESSPPPPPLPSSSPSSSSSPSPSDPPPSPPVEPDQGSSSTVTTTTTSQQQQQQQQQQSSSSPTSLSSSSATSPPPPPPPSSSSGDHHANNNSNDGGVGGSNDNNNLHLQPRPLTPTTNVNVYTALFDTHNNEDNKNKNKTSKDKKSSSPSSSKSKSNKPKSASTSSSTTCPIDNANKNNNNSNNNNSNTSSSSSSANVSNIPHPFSQLAISSDIPLPLPLPPFSKGDHSSGSHFHHDESDDKLMMNSDHKTATGSSVMHHHHHRCDDSGQGSSSPICDDRSDLKSDLSTDVSVSLQNQHPPPHHHHHHHHPPPSPPPPVVEETIAESSLPWRRQTSSLPPVPSSVSLSLPDDENPLMSEAPSWADNLAYHHLTESGSPYHSPYNTLTGANASPPTPPRPVFDLFPPSSPSPDEEDNHHHHHDHHNNNSNNHDNENHQQHQQLDSIPPPPWKDEDSGHIDEEPIPSHAAAATACRQGGGDKASCLLVSSHDLVPPSHHSCLEFRSHMMEGGAGAAGSINCGASGSHPSNHNNGNSNSNNNRLRRCVGMGNSASSPVHFQFMSKSDAFTSNVIESELIGLESDYHHQMRDRVAKWLALSPPPNSSLMDRACSGSGVGETEGEAGGNNNNDASLLSPEGEMILESLRKKKEQWEMEDTPSGTDADVEDDDDDDDGKDKDDDDDDDDEDDDGVRFVDTEL